MGITCLEERKLCLMLSTLCLVWSQVEDTNSTIRSKTAPSLLEIDVHGHRFVQKAQPQDNLCYASFHC